MLYGEIFSVGVFWMWYFKIGVDDGVLLYLIISNLIRVIMLCIYFL